MLNLNGFSVKIFFHIRYKPFLNFFICICKITCKPMGNFAENLNLGNRFRPPWFDIRFYVNGRAFRQCH